MPGQPAVKQPGDAAGEKGARGGRVRTSCDKTSRDHHQITNSYF
jgi:hypothetical protein